MIDVYVTNVIFNAKRTFRNCVRILFSLLDQCWHFFIFIAESPRGETPIESIGDSSSERNSKFRESSTDENSEAAQ